MKFSFCLLCSNLVTLPHSMRFRILSHYRNLYTHFCMCQTRFLLQTVWNECFLNKKLMREKKKYPHKSLRRGFFHNDIIAVTVKISEIASICFRRIERITWVLSKLKEDKKKAKKKKTIFDGVLKFFLESRNLENYDCWFSSSALKILMTLSFFYFWIWLGWFLIKK